MEESAVRKQLETVAKSPYFSHADRLLHLLRYVIEAKLVGQTERINQKQIAMTVFDRDDRFDSAIDSIVRVEVSRLRSKLMAYYADDGSSDPIRSIRRSRSRRSTLLGQDRQGEGSPLL